MFEKYFEFLVDDGIIEKYSEFFVDNDFWVKLVKEGIFCNPKELFG